jgi:hypothetical protein
MTRPPVIPYASMARSMTADRKHKLRGRAGDPSGLSAKAREILDRLAVHRRKQS